MISIQVTARVARMQGQVRSSFMRGSGQRLRGRVVSNGAKCRAFFNFNKNKDQEDDFRCGLLLLV